MGKRNLQLLAGIGFAAVIASLALGVTSSDSSPPKPPTPGIRICQDNCIQNRTNTFVPPDAPDHCTVPAGSPVDSPTPIAGDNCTRHLPSGLPSH